jgi:hypothetical protein
MPAGATFVCWKAEETKSPKSVRWTPDKIRSSAGVGKSGRVIQVLSPARTKPTEVIEILNVRRSRPCWQTLIVSAPVIFERRENVSSEMEDEILIYLFIKLDLDIKLLFYGKGQPSTVLFHRSFLERPTSGVTCRSLPVTLLRQMELYGYHTSGPLCSSALSAAGGVATRPQWRIDRYSVGRSWREKV